MDPVEPTPDPLADEAAALPAAEQLPDDRETLKRMVLELLATLAEERRDKRALRQRLDQLLRRLYYYSANLILLRSPGSTKLSFRARLTEDKAWMSSKCSA